MAEFVNERLEEMVPELEQMKRIDLYTPDEIKEISRKRKNFEYTIHKQTRRKEDYLSYIAYECILLKDISHRRKKSSITEKKKDIEYALCQRVNKLYKELLVRFPADVELWLSYFSFCKDVGFVPIVSRNLERLLLIHGDKPKIWQLACRWECNEASNFETARKLVLKGLHRHPDSEILHLEALKIELMLAKSVEDEDEKALHMKRANVVLENALDTISKIPFLINLCSLITEFEFAEELRYKLFNELWDKHKDHKEVWDFIAHCELKGKNTKGFDWESLNDASFDSDNLKKFFAVYETAILQLHNLDVCDYYITSALKLSMDDNVESDIRLEILKNAFSKGHELGKLTEDYYKIWIEILTSDFDVSRDDILEILEQACDKLPDSEYVWEERLKRLTSVGTEFDTVFKMAVRKLPKSKGVSIWKVAIENAKTEEHLQKLYKDSMSLQPVVGKELKEAFLSKFYDFGGIESVRKQYLAMVKVPPFSLEMHNKMISLEKNLVIPVYKTMRNCYELAIQQFGDKDIHIWLDYMKFEADNNHPDLCASLYKKACLELKNKLLADFIKLHCLNKDDS